MAQVMKQPGHCAGAFKQSPRLLSTSQEVAHTELQTPFQRSGSSGAQLATCVGGSDPLPTIDISPMLAYAAAHTDAPQDDFPLQCQQLCKAVADCLCETGCLIIRDPRVKAEDNTAFLDMMEGYFAQSLQSKLQDTRPELHFQVHRPKYLTTMSC